ncbi:MAG TPA: hypothetical protein VGD10_05585 [Allosphingosinicella sp.]|uniref:hypothetical protein n=1 Tax=Allosphingosinicella sp. TaxID=2823234 RepID=UPI002ED8B335
MLWAEKRLMAVFFVPDVAGERSLASLLLSAGATNQFVDTQGGLSFRWGGFDGVRAELARLSNHVCLFIGFWQSCFFKALHDEDVRPPPLLQDGLAELFYAFKETCVQLGADVALVATHLHEDDEWVLGRYPIVAEGNTAQLLDESFGLTFIRAGYGQGCPDVLFDREMVLSPEGVYTFGGTGWERWF